MPIPKPKNKEKKKDFISRCISTISDEYKDNKQAVAICYSQYEDSKLKASVVVGGDDDEFLVLSKD